MSVYVLLVITVSYTGFFNQTIDIQSGSLVFNTSTECEAGRIRVLELTKDSDYDKVSARCDKVFIPKGNQ